MNLSDLPPDRLTPLYDGTPGIRGSLTVIVSEPPSVSLSAHGRDGFHSVPDQSASLSAVGKDGVPSVPDQNPCLDFVASDESLDRYHEIVCVSGWNLANYQRNPVFQNAHQCSDIIHTLGRALATEVRTMDDRKVLAQRIQFATDVNPMAKVAYGLYRGKFLNAVSVGFVPVRWEPGSEKTNYRRKFIEQELIEVSAVGIPANPNALALGYKSGAIEKSDLLDLSDLINLTLCAGGKDRVPSVPNHTGSLSGFGGEGQGEVAHCSVRERGPMDRSVSPLLQLARDLQALFRKI
jgi:HK97 family phage prohead protease